MVVPLLGSRRSADVLVGQAVDVDVVRQSFAAIRAAAAGDVSFASCSGFEARPDGRTASCPRRWRPPHPSDPPGLGAGTRRAAPGHLPWVRSIACATLGQTAERSMPGERPIRFRDEGLANTQHRCAAPRTARSRSGVARTSTETDGGSYRRTKRIDPLPGVGARPSTSAQSPEPRLKMAACVMDRLMTVPSGSRAPG